MLNANAWYELADSAGYQQGESAYGASIGLPNTSRRNGSLVFAQLGENFHPALGFVNRAGIRQTDVRFGHIDPFTNGTLRSIASQVQATDVSDLQGHLQPQLIDLH